MENKIQKDLLNAMKAKDTVRVDTLRLIKAAIQNEKTNGSYHELTDADVIKLIQKLSKQHQESIEMYESAGRTDLVEKETAEKVILDEYLPKMMSNEELKSAIDEIVKEVNASNMKDMGKVMKELSNKYSGQYDGKTASMIIKEILSS